MADQIFQVNSCSFQDFEVSASLRVGPNVTVDFRQATTVTGSFSGAAQGLTGVSASFIISNPTTTASWANNAVAANTAGTANTASFVAGGNVVGTVATSTSSSFATNASNATAANTATSASWANTFPKELFTGSLYQITASVAVTASNAITASNATTASYSLTASNLNTVVTAILTGSDFTRTGTVNLATIAPLSFNVATGENWACDFYATVACSNARGVRFAISSSTTSASFLGNPEGWVFGGGNGVTAFSSARITNINALVATSVALAANTPEMCQIHFSIENAATASTISIAAGVTNTGDTATVSQGAYMVARRIPS